MRYPSPSVQRSGSWDNVAHLFDTSTGEVSPHVEDNLQVAWPILTRQLTDHLPSPRQNRIRILDFGCGPGGLARDLAGRGFEVLGVDSSPGMIALAEQHGQERTSFLVGSFQEIPPDATFHGIVASMAFQFVPDLETCLSRLTDHLLPGGILTFAVFNPEFVTADEHGIFPSSDRHLRLQMAEELFPVTANWGSDEYKAVLQGLGSTNLYDKCHAFPEGSTGVPEYLIMAFRKGS